MESGEMYNKAHKISEQIVKIMLRDEEGQTADLNEWIQANPTANEVTGQLSDPELLTQKVNHFIRPEKTDELPRLLKSIRRRERRRRMIRYSGVAAAVALFIGLSMTFIYHQRDATNGGMEEENAPMLILGNGQDLNLKSMSGEWISDDGTNIRNNRQGRIEYIAVENAGVAGEAEILNTLVIPRQCTYQVILSDGTVVHVNAESRLEYPVKFVGDERKVKLQGEAYFEVTKDTRPFVVCANEVEIKVYGTKFNVNAYHKDWIETALVEGRVGVSWKNQEKILYPSQLSQVDRITGEQLVTHVNIEQYISWISGYLRYDDDNLGKMMEDLARWYGVDFEFRTENMKEMRVSGSINKDLPLDNVLEMIQTTIKVTFIKQERGYLISRPL